MLYQKRREELSAIVAPLTDVSEDPLVISIVGDRDVPYEFMEQLRQELVASGALRVVYEAVDSLPLWSPAADVPALLDRGLGIILPGQIPDSMEVSQRNLLHLTVQPSGIVEVKRGADPQVQQVQPREIEGLWRQEVARNPILIAAVRTHPDAPYTFMIEVLDGLRAAKSERISLQILEN